MGMVCGMWCVCVQYEHVWLTIKHFIQSASYQILQQFNNDCQKTFILRPLVINIMTIVVLWMVFQIIASASAGRMYIYYSCVAFDSFDLVLLDWAECSQYHNNSCGISIRIRYENIPLCKDQRNVDDGISFQFSSTIRVILWEWVSECLCVWKSRESQFRKHAKQLKVLLMLVRQFNGEL